MIYKFTITIFMLLSLLTNLVWGQAKSWRDIDELATNVPIEYAQNIDSLAVYINKNIITQTAKARFIFTWIAKNVQYDGEVFFTLAMNYDHQTAQKAFETHKAVCTGYANLFHSLCQKTGLESWIIIGYALGQRIDGHAWNAVKINDTWHLLDVTWAAGGLTEDLKFVADFQDKYFMPKPTEFVKDHLPIDPAWQLLDNLVSVADFQGRKSLIIKQQEPKYNYVDTLNHFFSLDSMYREIDFCRRALAYNPSNSLLKSQLDAHFQNLKIIEHNQIVEQIKKAIKLFDKGNNCFNQYFTFKDEAFKYHNLKGLNANELKIRELLKCTEENYNKCASDYQNIKINKENEDVYYHNLANLKKNQDYLKKEKEFVDVFYKTPKLLRMNVLGNYNTLLRF